MFAVIDREKSSPVPASVMKVYPHVTATTLADLDDFEIHRIFKCCKSSWHGQFMI